MWRVREIDVLPSWLPDAAASGSRVATACKFPCQAKATKM